jgi:hypothetical protein
MMDIQKLLQNTAFEPKDIERLVVAYEHTLRALRLNDRSGAITQLVAEKIIAVGRIGIENPDAISKLACAEQTPARDALTTLTLIDRNICLVRDLDPARRFQTHQVSELLRCHGFGFGALI